MSPEPLTLAEVFAGALALEIYNQTAPLGLRFDNLTTGQTSDFDALLRWHGDRRFLGLAMNLAINETNALPMIREAVRDTVAGALSEFLPAEFITQHLTAQ